MAGRGEVTRERILSSARTLVMDNGFAGTSIDDILKSAGLTKGAFFHHFKGKAALARELVEWHAKQDLAMFDEFVEQAEAHSDDPLERVLYYLELFEGYVAQSSDRSPGCMYAVYTYESMQFDPSVRDFVADILRQWTSTYVRMFQDVIDRYPPALPVTARQLAETIVSIIEGGLVLQRAYEDVRITARQSVQFRNYLMLLFGTPESGKTAKKATRPAARRRPKATVDA
ncbi:MAG: TetR/AcrR family transcriptional regulator [Hyphomicrobiales bacterium]|nr:TetR/AcrR family transcriptional regulator [Hyphomicrobiales bacterium]